MARGGVSAGGGGGGGGGGGVGLSGGRAFFYCLGRHFS